MARHASSEVFQFDVGLKRAEKKSPFENGKFITSKKVFFSSACADCVFHFARTTRAVVDVVVVVVVEGEGNNVRCERRINLIEFVFVERGDRKAVQAQKVLSTGAMETSKLLPLKFSVLIHFRGAPEAAFRHNINDRRLMQKREIAKALNSPLNAKWQQENCLNFCVVSSFKSLYGILNTFLLLHSVLVINIPSLSFLLSNLKQFCQRIESSWKLPEIVIA